MNRVEPLAYLRDMLERLPTARARNLDALLPWNWKAIAAADALTGTQVEAPILSAE